MTIICHMLSEVILLGSLSAKMNGGDRTDSNTASKAGAFSNRKASTLSTKQANITPDQWCLKQYNGGVYSLFTSLPDTIQGPYTTLQRNYINGEHDSVPWLKVL